MSELNTVTISIERFNEFQAYEKAIKERVTLCVVDHTLFGNNKSYHICDNVLKEISDEYLQMKSEMIKARSMLNEKMDEFHKLKYPQKKWWQIFK